MQMIVNDASGSSQAIRSSVGSFSISIVLTLKLVSLVHVDRVKAVVEIECDGEGDSRLGSGQHDHKQRHELAVEADRGSVLMQIGTAESNEIQVRAIEHKLDTHQHADRVALGRHAESAANEQHSADDEVVRDT